MDRSLENIKLPIHDHPLATFSGPRFSHERCTGCRFKDSLDSGYFCREPGCVKTIFHKECGEAPLEIINHPYHLQHPLKLSTNPRDRPCDLCRTKSFDICYLCSVCDFIVDLRCGIKPSPIGTLHQKSHEHPLVLLEKGEVKLRRCEICYINYTGHGACPRCDIYFHDGYANHSQEVNHPSHPQHLLKLLVYQSLTRDADKTCLLCGFFKYGPRKCVIYRCSICNFSICLYCTKYPPPLTIEHQKTHEHQLLLLSRRISYECNACGMPGDQSPYICIQCGFVVHRTCINLPRVININRHDHRMSFTHHLGVGYSKCGICRKDISQYYGAYFCSRCPDYAAHSLCATSKDVWDGVELEGTPEDDEDIEPFKVVGDNLIKHFSHEEHNLRLKNDNINRDESSRCEACVLPIYSDPIYNCEECSFILHEKCANLPKKKRHVFHTKPFTLWFKPPTPRPQDFKCDACGTQSTGFRYISDSTVLDVRCGLRFEPVIHDCHKHPLYYERKLPRRCNVCDREIRGYYLNCDTCDFALDLCCADIPKVVKHKCDDHPFFLCCGENAKGKYWCEICEAETDPSKWFYTCSDCGVSAHIKCVLGDFSCLMPGCIINYNQIKVEVVPNNRNSRPLCANCNFRCRAPVILKLCDPHTGYICSDQCTRFSYKYKSMY